MAKIFTRRITALLVILILIEIVFCVSIEDRALASDSLLTSSEKYLIKKYGWGEGDYVRRWPDGIIYVYNGTTYKGLPKIIKKINQIIGGKTVFQLSNDKEISKVVFKSYASTEYAYWADWGYDGYNFKKWVTSVSNEYIHDARNNRLFLASFVQIAGFNYKADEKKYGEWWEFSIDRNVEKMLKALYKVPPGYNLSTGKVDEIAPGKFEHDELNHLSEVSITKYWGKLYNACDGTCSYTGEALDFYIDGAFIATINSGENLSIELTAGEHTFRVLLTKTQKVLETDYKLFEISEGWWYWWGCDNGTHP